MIIPLDKGGLLEKSINLRNLRVLDVPESRVGAKLVDIYRKGYPLPK